MSSYVIVGASRGLGYEWLRQLSQDKSNTVIGVVRSLESVQTKLDSDKISNVRLVQGDLEDNKSLKDAAAQTSVITGGTLDHLIINGAYLSNSWHLDPTEFEGREELLAADFVRSVEINIAGNMYTMNAFLPLIRKGNAKKIVTISSGHADLDLILKGDVSACVVYSAMKAALNVVIAKYAAQLRPEGIKLLSLSPGVVNTDQAPPTEEQMKKFPTLLGQFQKLYPEWKGAMQPDESVRAQRKVIDNLAIDQSGQFLSHWGNKQWL